MDDAQYGQDKRSTIYDVAAAAGVSHMTVSRVLNGHPNIREATRERVLAAIEELGYRPNSIARALASKRAMSLGIIVDRPSQYGPRSTLLALERAARESGYSVHVYSLLGSADESEIARAVAEFDAAGLDAMCAIVRRYDAFEQLRATRSKLPTVLAADVADAEAGARSVAIDQRQVALTAMAHLGAYGHRRVLHLSGPLDTVDGRKREQGWREAAREYGDAEPRLVVGDWTSEAGYALGATGDLGECTAVFAANDQMALGLLHGLSTRGVRVPQDISVVGCDDQPEAAHLSPPLTTVRQDFSALGAAIISSALEAIDDPLGSAAVRLPPQLIVRDSTRRLTV